MQNINVSCIAQDANGTIYIGTGEGFSLFSEGEGFSSAIMGGGMFKSTDDGKTWRLLPKTVPTANTPSGWAYINRIAIRPDSFKVIYAATTGGLMISHDSGATWTNVINAVTKAKLPGNSLDVKISVDGSIIVASVAGTGYYCSPQQGADNVFTEMRSSGAGRLPTGGSRIEFAISPTNPNRIYASYIASNGSFGPNGAGSGIFMTKTALTNGGYWYDIGPGGSIGFDPYYVGGNDQATYDNTLAVAPDNEMELLCGGTTLNKWLGLSSNDTISQWHQISDYSGGPGDNYYIHPDEHTLVFDLNNPNTLFIGCDGGVFKSVNATAAETQNGRMTFAAMNRDYNVTQYYSICFSPEVTYTYSTPTSVIGLGMGGGTQDNGSPYIAASIPHLPNDGFDMSGGDGGGSAVSFLNPNIGYFCTDYGGSLVKVGNLINYPPSISSAYTKTYGVNLGANIDSVATAGDKANTTCFVFPVALYENSYDTLNHDSLQYIATQRHRADTTIWLQDQNGPTLYPYILPKALKSGDTITVPDRVVSRLAVGFDRSNGIWINGQGASNGLVVWMPIAGPTSTPTPFSNTVPPATNPAIHCLTWTPDGDALFAGCEDGVLFRFSNINSIIANKYASGALWYEKNGAGDIYYDSNQVISNNISIAAASGRDILSIAVDPQNGNNVLVTLGNYNSTTYVYYSTNALSSSPAFNSVQGNLPDMPVYGSILNILGHGFNAWNPGSAMLATEHGIYTTSKLNGNSTVWVKNNKGLANCLTLAVKQEILPGSMCNNSGDIYVGSHGRGAWVSNTNFTPTGVPLINSSSAVADNLRIYPNPMTTEGNLEYTLSSADNVTITIYDIQGKEMQTIAEGSQSPGNHIISFATSSLSAGTYFVSITNGTSFRKTGKFVVIK